MASFVTAENIRNGDTIYPGGGKTAHTVTGIAVILTSYPEHRIYTDRAGPDAPYIYEPDDMIKRR